VLSKAKILKEQSSLKLFRNIKLGEERVRGEWDQVPLLPQMKK